MKRTLIAIAIIGLGCAGVKAQNKKPADTSKVHMQWKQQKPEKKDVADTTINIIDLRSHQPPTNPNAPVMPGTDRRAPNTDLINIPAKDGVPKK